MPRANALPQSVVQLARMLLLLGKVPEVRVYWVWRMRGPYGVLPNWGCYARTSGYIHSEVRKKNLLTGDPFLLRRISGLDSFIYKHFLFISRRAERPSPLFHYRSWELWRPPEGSSHRYHGFVTQLR